VKLQQNYNVWKNKLKIPLDNTTGEHLTTDIQATKDVLQLIMPLRIQVREIHQADMVNDKTVEMIPLEIWHVISQTNLHVVEAIMVAHLAVIKMVAEVMVADKTLMVEAVVVAEHLTLEEPTLLPEIPTLHVMDVARIIMSWPVQPLQKNENGLS
jgi:hypothetical protein